MRQVLLSLTLLATLAACSQEGAQTDADQLDAKLTGKAGEAAVEPVSVDPARTTPHPGVDSARFEGCALDVSYSPDWARKLPAGIPLHPQAKVEESAGSDNAACRLRAVSYTTPAPLGTMADYYRGAMEKAGYSATYTTEKGEQIVGGSRDDGGAYYIVFTKRPTGGTMVDIVANKGT
jgi:hypothetical protein